MRTKSTLAVLLSLPLLASLTGIAAPAAHEVVGYVVGDSISTPGTWTTQLEAITSKHYFSQAIGGSASPAMVGRARGVELVTPTTPPTAPGTVHMKWSRHIADRSHDPKYKAEWAACAKSVSEPTAITVYQKGKLLGQAKHQVKKFTTAYASNPKTIHCPGHGLKEGERVAFISNDPEYPNDINCSDSRERWAFSSPKLPHSIVERRVYFVANVTPNSFELKEMVKDAETLDLGGDATGSPDIDYGWTYDVNFSNKGPWEVTWSVKTKYDNLIWLMEVSANDIPMFKAEEITIPNAMTLLKQMSGTNPRFIIVCPPSGSFIERGPGTFNWKNYYETYMPWVKKTFPNNHIDVMALFETKRTAKELSLLADPKTPECLWIKGKPGEEGTWEGFKVATPDAFQSWVGPGYIPLQFRASFSDSIHPNASGNKVIAEAVAAMLKAKGW